MPASWVRRSFDGVGVTQYPPGPHLDAVADHFLGSALLCIDISGSMSGEPLAAACRGGEEFLAEAAEAHYRVGLVLWNQAVEMSVSVGEPAAESAAALRRASSRGGTNLAPTLRHAIAELAGRSGDRVVCVFGDGDVGDVGTCVDLVRNARARGIRFVVRGLGEAATRGLASVLTPGEERDDQLVRGVGELSTGIASMARSLRRHPG